ncbi:hypothetical protein [Corynebacterium cystitidis]|uniref:hypothetical protein n=1 Tax=Corynebacterium cystitidis TaxID=35757 RepID=UPI00211EFC9C|nr:hypothetical protein [Corynebacterium cystitidis]
MPQADGSWQGTLRIPADLEPGAYWVRVLSGTDGDPAGPISKLAWFEVLENDGTTPLYEPDVTVTAQGFGASLQVKGFQPGEKVTATINGQPVKYSNGEESVTAGPEGSFQTALDLTATPVLANEQAELVLTGSEGTVKNSRFRGSPEITVNTPHGSGIPLGSTITLTVRNVPPTTSVDNIGVLGINLIEDHPDRSNAVASAAGTVSILDIKIPVKEELLGQEMAVMLRLPGEDRNRRYDSGLTFTAAQSQPSPAPQPDPGTKPNPDPGTQPSGSSLSSNGEGNNATQSSTALGIAGGIMAVLAILAAVAASQGLLPLHLLPF